MSIIMKAKPICLQSLYTRKAKQNNHDELTYHPHIRRNKHPNLIVNIIYPIIMIENECPLHPSLPFLRLLSTQADNARISSRSARFGSLPFPGKDCCNCQECVDDPKHRRGMIIISRIGWFKDVTSVSDA